MLVGLAQTHLAWLEAAAAPQLLPQLGQCGEHARRQPLHACNTHVCQQCGVLRPRLLHGMHRSLCQHLPRPPALRTCTRTPHACLAHFPSPLHACGANVLHAGRHHPAAGGLPEGTLLLTHHYYRRPLAQRGALSGGLHMPQSSCIGLVVGRPPHHQAPAGSGPRGGKQWGGMH